MCASLGRSVLHAQNWGSCDSYAQDRRLEHNFLPVTKTIIKILMIRSDLPVH